MQQGRNEALLRVLNKLSHLINSSANIIVDERGLLISEYMETHFDKNAIAVMSSVLNGTSRRFIDTLNLRELNLLTLNTSKGIFLIKEIPIIQLNRKFTLSVFIEKGNGVKRSKPHKFKQYFFDLFRISKFTHKNNANTKKILEIINQSILEILHIFNR